jgi:hypothetical protein
MTELAEKNSVSEKLLEEKPPGNRLTRRHKMTGWPN